MKTREEVENLKQQWLADGCWDIETTEGFEDYKDELLKFRLETEQKYKEKEQNRLWNKAKELQLWKNSTTELNIALLKYLENLEYQIDRLSKRIECLENPVDDGSWGEYQHFKNNHRGR